MPPAHVHRFSNGLTLLVEPMQGVRSAAMQILVPAGSMHDLPTQRGMSNVISEMTLRGAGTRDSRELTNALDLLGLQRSMSVAVYHARYSAAAVASKVLDSIPIYADIMQRPHMTADDFDASRDLAEQSLVGLDDDPRTKSLIYLREKHWPAPEGLNTMGTAEGLASITLPTALEAFSNTYHAGDTIIALAGDVKIDDVVQRVGSAFESWKTGPKISTSAVSNGTGVHFIEQPSEQTHIAIAYPTFPEMTDEYYIARVSAEVLSGGMSGRLFTEVREKRGLCYSVGVSYGSLRGRASMLGYAGTSNERAQATLDCFLGELRRFSDGVTQAELDRAKIGLKASVVMSGESTSARAGAIASDFFFLGRPRPLEEITAMIDLVNLDDTNVFLKANPAGPFTIVVLGPKPLEITASI